MSASLADRRGLRLVTFCVLYVAQGIPWGFTAVTLPAYLASRLKSEHLDAGVVGTTLAMTTLPYTFKPVWALLVDALPSKRFGKRRPWIIGAQLGMALTIGAMIAIPDLTSDLHLLAWMIFVHTIFNSVQDLSTDALAVDLLDDDERGRTNGIMYASKWGGGILGGAGMSALIGAWGMRPALAAQTAVLLAIMLLPLLVRERPPGAEPDAIAPSVGERVAQFVGDLKALARSPAVGTALLGGGLMLVSSIGVGLMTAAAPVLFMEELGWGAEPYGKLIGGIGLAAGCAGSILGGLLADRVGHRRLAAIGTVALAIVWTVWALCSPYWHDHALVYVLVVLEPMCVSLVVTPLFALCMDLTWPKVGATQFGIYMALANASTTIGYKLAGIAIATWSYVHLYLGAAALQLVVLAILPFIDPHAVRRALAAERGG